MEIETTNCAKCLEEIPIDEAQKCEECGQDGLGNCCIGRYEHDCLAYELEQME